MPDLPVNDILRPLQLTLPSYTGAEIAALPSPEAGTIVLNTTTSKLNFYTGSGWEAITSA